MVGIILSVPLGIFLPIVILLLAGIVASVIFCLKQGVKKGKELQKQIIDKELSDANISAEKIIEEAKEQAEKTKNEKISESKREIQQLKHEADNEIRERKRAVQDAENKINQRESRLDNRSASLDKREDSLTLKEHKIDERKAEIEEQYNKAESIVHEQEKKLMEISNLSQEKARTIILERVENDMSLEIASYIKDEEEKAKIEVARKAKSLLVNAIQQYSNDTVYETTVSVVALPNDEMKGRIIGREGRNIRAIEAATGVDIIIDDTPEAVVLSCFDPIRREIARRAMEALIQDGRIQPPRIEELVAKYKKELDVELREAGEKAVFETGIGKIHPDLVKLIGRLKYRTSYGQNVLKHSLEVAFLAGKLAVEIGENEILARRAGLLHDIGKSIDAEMEGSHVDIGLELANRYREKPEVIDAIGSHHGDREPSTLIAPLVAAADTLSAARPGARSESLDNYIKRLTQLEDICNGFKGVEKAYALQAGREIRVLVKPEEITDVEAYKIARDMRIKIENDVQYPGTIKVVVIRELRVNEVAK
ncbi:MAG: ribonuclease Y [Bacilli bacterium]|nr:ribonuclease Y [Acholeplasmataceae bacterium]MDY2902149.1 ribonuclease Y [Bacilli bacterium]